jgi:prepilin-type N-terminal cleavage/methylation domain-containing protein
VSRGFSLTEVIVAMTLLSVGSVTIAATALVSVQSFTRAEQQQRALAEAESILDSLITHGAAASGSRSRAYASFTWTAADSANLVSVNVHLRSGARFQLMGSR